MKGGKAAEDDGITVDHSKDGGNIVLEKLAETILGMPQNYSWKAPAGAPSLTNSNILLIHKKGDVKELKIYRPYKLLSALYKLFTKVVAAYAADDISNQENGLY